MSDTRPPVPSQGPRRPSLGAEDHKANSPADKQQQSHGKHDQEVTLPRITIPEIKVCGLLLLLFLY